MTHYFLTLLRPRAGISTSVNVTELREIATDPDETHMFFTPSFDKLASIKHHVLAQICYGSGRRHSAPPPPAPRTPVDLGEYSEHTDPHTCRERSCFVLFLRACVRGAHADAVISLAFDAPLDVTTPLFALYRVC